LSMNVKRRPPALPLDPSLHPTRKVESMSSLAAELLLQGQDESLDDVSAPRVRSNPPPFDNRPSRPTQSEPRHPSAPPATFYVAQPPLRTRSGARIALLVVGALLLVGVTVMVTLVVAR
jgi:hypothetical protein